MFRNSFVGCLVLLLLSINVLAAPYTIGIATTARPGQLAKYQGLTPEAVQEAPALVDGSKPIILDLYDGEIFQTYNKVFPNQAFYIYQLDLNDAKFHHSFDVYLNTLNRDDRKRPLKIIHDAAKFAKLVTVRWSSVYEYMEVDASREGLYRNNPSYKAPTGDEVFKLDPDQ